MDGAADRINLRGGDGKAGFLMGRVGAMMMEHTLTQLTGGEIIAIVAISGGLVLALVLGLAGIIFVNWRRWRQFQCEAALKQELVRKEMRVEDIERIIRVTHPDHLDATRQSSTPTEPPVQEMTPRQLDARVAATLAGMDLDADKIEQALGAVVAADHEAKLAVLQALTKMIDDGVDEEKVLACVLGLCRSPRTAAITTL
jgi:hypothetical protein